ncbi:DUF946 domain-containing protein [Chromobacterium haemolyticum]|nr:DUF946 domain-containing protein [Chromobacterium haemolyticum]
MIAKKNLCVWFIPKGPSGLTFRAVTLSKEYLMNSPILEKQILEVGSAKLIITMISSYLQTPLYTDKGSGADKDVSIWRANPPSPSQFLIGDHAQNNYNKPTEAIQVVQVEKDDPSSPLLAPPLDYTLIWTDQGSGADMDGSIWMPSAPDGYVAIGAVCQTGYNKPNVGNYRCVRRDLVIATAAGDLIWNDKGSGAKSDVSLYAINSAPGSFIAVNNYVPPSNTLYCLKR